MTYDEINRAMNEAKWLMEKADIVAERALPLVAGRLHMLDIGHDVLRQLKRELSRYNTHTGKWKP